MNDNEEDLSSGNISSDSSGNQSSALNSNIRKLDGGIQNEVNNNFQQFYQIQDSPDKKMMSAYKRQNEEVHPIGRL